MAGRFSVEAVFRAVDRITAPVSRMQNRVGKFTRGMSRSFHKLNKVVARVNRGLLGAAKSSVKLAGIGIGVLTGAVGLLIREFSKVEDAEAAFTPLLGGVKKAKELVQELNDTAASTPFQFENLTAAASQLLPVMDGDIQNTIKTIRMLGDTAGGNAQKLDSITRGFTKAMLKGKVDMESLNMIAEAGVPIFGDLADVIGVKMGPAFFKMVSAGKVSTAQLTKAFEKLTGKGGKFFRGMEIASKTTSGMFSTFKDNVSLTAAELGGVLAPTVKEIILRSTEVAKSIREWVKANRDMIGTRFVEFVKKVKDTIIELKDPAIRLFTFLRDHGATIAKVAAGFAILSLGLQTFVGVMSAVNLVMSLNPIGLMIIAVAALIALIATLVLKWDDIKASFTDFELPSFLQSSFGADFDPEDYGQDDVAPQVVSPQARVAASIEEQRTTSTAEVTIKDDTGRAEVTGGKLGNGLNLQQSGAF